MRVEVFSRKRLLSRPKWYFRVRSSNGEILAQSEGYSRRLDCIGTVHSMKTGLPNAEIVDA